MPLFRKNLPRPITWPPPSTREGVAAVLRYVRMRDPIGHQVHALIAGLYLVTLPLATAPKDWAYAALLFYAVLRVPHTWRCYPALLRSGVLWAWLAWAAWIALSLTWSTDVAEGAKEDLGAMRLWFVPLALWPIIERVPWLVACLLLGVGAQHVVQLAQWMEWFGLAPDDGRMRGLLHPIQTGAFCAAAMCWHLSGTMHGRGGVRALSLAGLLAASAGLFATGSRGPWLAGAIAMPVAVILIMVRRPATRRMGIALIAAGVIAAAGAWPVVDEMIQQRVQDAVNEAEAAEEDRVYTTSVGLRLAQWEWAWRMFREHPIRGVGAGSYREAQRQIPDWQRAVANRPEKLDYLDRGHPHSTYLYALASTGAIGSGLLLLFLILTMRQTWRDPAHAPAPPDHIYADVMFTVIIAWLIGAQFDCYELNGHTFGLLAIAIAFTMPNRPPARTTLAASDAADELAIGGAGRGSGA